MKRFNRNFVLAILAALVLSVAASAGVVEIKLRDGSRWRGEVNDVVKITFVQSGVEVPIEGTLKKVENLYLVVDGATGGIKREKTIFRADIVSMQTVTKGGGAADTPAAPNASQPAEPNPPAGTTTGSPVQIFVLPLEGSVGETFRKEEIVKMGEYMDKQPPGDKILVLLIDSNGGSSAETEDIGKAIYAIRKKHRVVAWIHKAISAGCQTAMYCNEVYFMREGTAGAVTTWNPGTGQAVQGEMQEKIVDFFVDVATTNGHSEHIARAMKLNKYMCSYDKDPVTGQVTYYGDLSGEFILSDEKSNLSFTAQVAEHCGFSDGTADTTAELGKLLDLPKWEEKSDYGRKLAKDWQALCEKADEEIPLLINRMQFKDARGQIQIIQEMIRWWDRCPNIAQKYLPPKEDLERDLDIRRRQLNR